MGNAKCMCANWTATLTEAPPGEYVLCVQEGQVRVHTEVDVTLLFPIQAYENRLVSEG